MKTLNLKYKLIACLFIALTTIGCDNAEYSIIDNGIYIEQASSINSQKISVNKKETTTITINVRLAHSINMDTKAKIVLDPTLVTKYNETYKTFYESIPEDLISFEHDVIIPAGEVSSSDITITIKPYSTTNGESYAVPIKIIPVTNIQTLGSSQSYTLLLNQPLLQSVPNMNTSNYTKPINPEQPWGLVINQWTLEGWVNMDGFSINNQAIWRNATDGVENEIYIRFGDAPIPWNSLQIKTIGSQVNTVTLFEPNKWYHIALTYNSAGFVSVYINGTLDVSVQTKGGDLTMDGLELVTSGSWFRNNVQMGQLRLWKVALGQAQIAGNMHYSAISTDENLIGYWKLDEGEGNIFHDSTPSARHLEAPGTLQWIPDVDFN